jgi:23S rRNA (pseudouridine1915-N3)-methyltransferase
LKLVLLFLGKTREKYLEEAITDYAGRLNRYLPVEIIVLKEKYNRNAADIVVKKTGSDFLLERCEKGSLKVALDLSGKQYDSPGVAAMLQGWQDRGVHNVYFLIGGHLGLDKKVVDAADVVWSLSKLTFTHEMTRMLILEQLYRACTINAGQKYHK